MTFKLRRGSFWESVHAKVNNEVNSNFKVTQMKHPKKANEEGRKNLI
ncbi:hypothetical protein M2M55_05910 [Enterococcus faecalis]|nr:hypothetical protein [Enterococcus faecalis]